MTYSRQNLRPQNQNNNQKQNISFGRFADSRARSIAYDYLDAGNDDCGKDAFDYLDETSFVTIKSAVNKGKAFIYAIVERSAVNKHKNKNLFDEMLSDLYLYDRRERAPFNRDAKETGAINEPGFLTGINNFTRIHNIYENFSDCETGYYAERGGSLSDSSKPVESNLEKGWDLYGTRN